MNLHRLEENIGAASGRGLEGIIQGCIDSASSSSVKTEPFPPAFPAQLMHPRAADNDLIGKNWTAPLGLDSPALVLAPQGSPRRISGNGMVGHVLCSLG